MKKTRKLLAILLVACLIASFAPMSFADEPVPQDAQEPPAEGGEATVTITQDEETVTMEAEPERGMVEVTDAEATGSLEVVSVYLTTNSDSDYTYGDIVAGNSEDRTLAKVDSSGDIQLDVKVNGDIGAAETAETAASGNGISLSNSNYFSGESASATTTEVTITATGNVNATSGETGPSTTGISALSEVQGESKNTIISNVIVDGYVSVAGGSGEGSSVPDVNGVDASATNYANGNAKTEVTVNGSDGITVTGSNNDTYGITAGAFTNGTGSAEVGVTVTGSGGVYVETKDGFASGILAQASSAVNNDNEVSGENEKPEDNGQRKVIVNVENGGVTVTGSNATGVSAEGSSTEEFNGTAEITVKQDIFATANGDEGVATGLYTSASEESTIVTLDVGGVVATSKGKDGAAFGVSLNASEGAKVNATVGANGITATGSNATGIYTLASGKGTEVNLAAEGITAESNANNVAHGVILYAQDKAAVTATIGQGGIFADGGAEKESGASLTSTDGAFVSLDVAGDVTSNNGNGIELGSEPSSDQAEETAPGSIDVFVEGTVYGKQNSILLNDSSMTSENVAITVWSTSYNTDGQIVGIRETDNEEEKAALNAAAGDIESNIRYIIKIGDSGKEYDNLEIGGAAVKDDTTHGYYVARAYDETEATIVSLKAVEGYQLVGVVHDEKDHTIRQDIIVQDTDGNYLLLIPHGGGLWISVSLEKIPEPSDDSSSVEFVLMALGRIIANDGSVLTIYNNRTYTVAYADGSNDNGTWKIADSLLVFTSSAGEEIAPELNADGDAVYTFKAGTEFVISPDIVDAVQSYRMF